MRRASDDVIVALARGWIGTPYCHGASCRGAGADCLGLVRGVWRDLFGAEAEAPPAYGAHWAESGKATLLTDALSRNMRLLPGNAEGPGQVLLFAAGRGGPAKHLGIQTAPRPEAAFVHAYSGHGVVESALTQPWRRRLVARFAFPID